MKVVWEGNETHTKRQNSWQQPEHEKLSCPRGNLWQLWVFSWGDSHFSIHCPSLQCVPCLRQMACVSQTVKLACVLPTHRLAFTTVTSSHTCWAGNGGTRPKTRGWGLCLPSVSCRRSRRQGGCPGGPIWWRWLRSETHTRAHQHLYLPQLPWGCPFAGVCAPCIYSHALGDSGLCCCTLC